MSGDADQPISSRALETPNASKARTIFRWLRRGAGVVVLLSIGLLIFGWRYGFTQLPYPVPGIAPSEPLQRLCVDVGEDDGWCGSGQLAGYIPGEAERAAPLLNAVSSWSYYGPPGITNWIEVRKCLEDEPELCAACDGVVTVNHPESQEALYSFSAARVAHAYQIWQCLEAERTGASAMALRHLLCAAQVTSQWPSVSLAGFGSSFRRISIEGHEIKPEEISAILADLARVRSSLPVIEPRIWDRLMSEREEISDAMSEYRDCRPVQAAVCEAFGALLGVGRNQISLPDRLGMTLLEPTDGWRIIVAEPLSQFVQELPFERLLVAISAKLARDEDIERALRAVGSHAIGRLATGRTDLGVAPEFHQDWDSRWVFIDRPWLWNAVGRFVWAAQNTLENRRLLCLEFESCGVVLAMRRFRDAHGRWPERLDDLVPAILPVVPRDPFDGATFRYQVTTNGWVLWCAAPGVEYTPERIASAISKSEPGVFRPRLAGLRAAWSSKEPELQRQKWAKRRAQAEANASRCITMDPALARRYGLKIDPGCNPR